jgi:transposase
MKKLSVQTINSCINLLQNGRSVSEIASELKIGRASVDRIKKKHCPDLLGQSAGRPRKIGDAALRNVVRKMAAGELTTAVDAKIYLEKDLHVCVNYLVHLDNC